MERDGLMWGSKELLRGFGIKKKFDPEKQYKRLKSVLIC